MVDQNGWNQTVESVTRSQQRSMCRKLLLNSPGGTFMLVGTPKIVEICADWIRPTCRLESHIRCELTSDPTESSRNKAHAAQTALAAEWWRAWSARRKDIQVIQNKGSCHMSPGSPFHRSRECVSPNPDNSQEKQHSGRIGLPEAGLPTRCAATAGHQRLK